VTVKVTLKLATSLDGRIATASGESQWITGQEARLHVHQMRADHDAVLVGIGTVLADDPMLTVRLPDYEGRQPTRVVLDTRLRLPPNCKLASTVAYAPTTVITRETDTGSLAGTQVQTITILAQPDEALPLHRPKPEKVLEILEGEGIRSVMIEGGGEVAAAFIRAGLVDAIAWFRAPILLGGDGRPALGKLGVGHLTGAPRFRRVDVTVLGEDVLERYERT